VIGLRTIKWEEHEALVGKLKIHTTVELEKLKGRDYLGDLVIDGGIILKWIIKK
jgi:hypothetical protein